MKIESKPVQEKIQKIAAECSEAGATEWETAKIINALSEEELNKKKNKKKSN